MTTAREDINEAVREFNSRRLSVSEVLRAEPGTSYKVYGMISSLSPVYRMVTGEKLLCPKCGYDEHEKYEMALPQPKNPTPRKCTHCDSQMQRGNYTYVPTINVELMDTDSFSEIERLPVAFFADTTKNVNIGERVTVRGKLHIIQNRRKGKLFQIVYADSVQYEERDKLELTPKDVQAIERFVKMKGDDKVIEALVRMHSPEIIGHNSVKEGLLMVEVNTGHDVGNIPRKRINALLVGPPGIAKTFILKSSVRHVPKSRFESGQHSTGKSLTAIIEKEQDMHILRLGPAPLAREAILAVNELGRMHEDDQGQLLDLMEEGSFTCNKHGINSRIRADTAIIASANPVHTTWKGNEGGDSKIDLNEIPALKVMLDRFDLIFVMKSVSDEDEIRKYAEKKSDMDGRNPANYDDFLRKYLQYAKSINPVIKVSDEAKSILNETYVKIAVRGIGTPRVRDTLYRLAKARTRLKLKGVVDVNDARETVQFYNIVIQQSQDLVSTPESPDDAAYGIMVDILRKSNGVPLGLAYLVDEASKQSDQVATYLDGAHDIGSSRKLRRVVQMLLNHDRIKQVQQRPIVLQWMVVVGEFAARRQEKTKEGKNHQEHPQNLSDASDASDAQKQCETSQDGSENLNNYNFLEPDNAVHLNEPASETSARSDRVVSNCTFLYQIEVPEVLEIDRGDNTGNYYYFSYTSGSARSIKTSPTTDADLDAIYSELVSQGYRDIYKPVHHGKFYDILPDEWLSSLPYILCWECDRHDAYRLYSAAKLVEHLRRRHSQKFSPKNDSQFSRVCRKDIIMNQIASPEELRRAIEPKTKFECPDRGCCDKGLIFSSPAALMRHVKEHNNEWIRQTLAWLEVLGLAGNKESTGPPPESDRAVDDGGVDIKFSEQ
jgi:DNA replicative helicase MCM subunit Mcm2 (Cdc46/Mcm family)